MQARLTINAPDFDLESLQDLTREFCLAINQETNLQADLTATAIIPGEKGNKNPIGKIDLKSLAKVSIDKLINLLKIFFDRSESLVLELEDSSGNKAKLEIKKRDLKDNQIKRTQDLLEAFFAD